MVSNFYFPKGYLKRRVPYFFVSKKNGFVRIPIVIIFKLL